MGAAARRSRKAPASSFQKCDGASIPGEEGDGGSACGASRARGGLISYGLLQSDHFVPDAAYVDKILKGAKPGDLPVEQPTRYELFVNPRTAKLLSLTLPQSVLLRADEVIP